MSNFVISVEVLAGTSIEEAVQEAKDLCIRLGVAYVMFRFNGIEFSVGANADPSLADQKLGEVKLLKNKQNHKFVVMNGN